MFHECTVIFFQWLYNQSLALYGIRVYCEFFCDVKDMLPNSFVVLNVGNRQNCQCSFQSVILYLILSSYLARESGLTKSGTLFFFKNQ